MNPFPILIRIAAGFVLATLAACGGGGGGGGGLGPVVYSGNTNAAVITTTNASLITSNVIGGSDVTIIGGVSLESSIGTQNRGTGPADLARRLGRDFREVAVRVKQAASNQQAVSGVLVPVNDVFFCDGGGSINITGTIDNITGLGTLSATFVNCVVDGITINGPSTWRIDAFDFFVFEPTDLTISFERLRLRGTGLSLDGGGSIRFQLSGATETFTINVDEMNNSTGKMRRVVNLVITNISLSPTSFNQTLVTGQVYHSDFGYVDVATITPFFFGTLEQLFPDSGEALLTGTATSTIRVTALSSTMTELQLDLDGNSVVDNTARLKWTELTGPIGANLGDTDGDGMHNSWETFYGLDPAVDDAAGDKDNDLVTNINEYMAGTTP